jgi:hypothetical protein
MEEIDINRDKFITTKELLSHDSSFNKVESWRNSLHFNFNLRQKYKFDPTLQKFIEGSLSSSSDIRVNLKSIAVDDDGSGPRHGDVHHQEQVDFKYRVKDPTNKTVLGAPNADEVAYIVRRGVLPDGGNIIGLINKGDFGIIIYNGRSVAVAAMDAKKPEGEPLAEASVKALRELGFEPFPKPGSGVGLIGKIEVIMFPGTTKTGDKGFVYTQDNINLEHRNIQFDRLLEHQYGNYKYFESPSSRHCILP